MESVASLESAVQWFLDREVGHLAVYAACMEYAEAASELGGYHPGRHLTANTLRHVVVYNPKTTSDGARLWFSVSLRDKDTGYSHPTGDMTADEFVGMLKTLRALP